MTRLVDTARLRSARVRAEDVSETTRAGRLVLFALLDTLELPCAVRIAIKVAFGFATLLEHGKRRHAEHLDNFVHLVELVVTVKERLAGVHLDENASETPHVDGHVVREAEQDFGRAIEATLNVLIKLVFFKRKTFSQLLG